VSQAPHPASGQRLVTVLLTLAVPDAADPDDAAALAAQAAADTALHVIHATGIEGHLPAPGTTVTRTGSAQPWTAATLTPAGARLRDISGHTLDVSHVNLQPDPLGA
jgi:hypothetical protein